MDLGGCLLLLSLGHIARRGGVITCTALASRVCARIDAAAAVLVVVSVPPRVLSVQRDCRVEYRH